MYSVWGKLTGSQRGAGAVSVDPPTPTRGYLRSQATATAGCAIDKLWVFSDTDPHNPANLRKQPTWQRVKAVVLLRMAATV